MNKCAFDSYGTYGIQNKADNRRLFLKPFGRFIFWLLGNYFFLVGKKIKAV